MAPDVVPVAVSVSADYAHNVVMAMPVLVVPMVLFLRRVSKGPLHAAHLAVLVVLVLLTVSIPFQRNEKGSYETKVQFHRELNVDTDERLISGERLDALMDACGYDRFLVFGEFAAGYMMRHSPYQIYGERRAFAEEPNEYLRAKYFEDLNRTTIVIMVKNPNAQNAWQSNARSFQDPEVIATMGRDFSEEAPACAKQFLPLHEWMDVYFRKEE